MTALADRFSACRTAADFYRVQIDAENILSPAEIAALDPAALPPPAAAWLARLRGMLALAGAGVQRFRRRDLADNAIFYEGDGEGPPRCLVVAFTGIALRMNVPAPAFLQALPAASCDVVILRDPGRAGFLSGVPGYAADLPALAARLAADLPGGRHPDGIRCIGTSAGGAAALYLGRLVRARRAVSVDGAHPAGLKLRLAAEVDKGALDAAVAGMPPGADVLVAAHGISDPRDAVRGRLLAAGLPGAHALTIAVQGPHGLFGTLLARRLLARFLAEVLLADTPRDALPATWPAAG